MAAMYGTYMFFFSRVLSYRTVTAPGSPRSKHSGQTSLSCPCSKDTTYIVEAYHFSLIEDFDMRDISKMRNFVRAPLSEPDMSVRSQVGNSILLIQHY